MYGGLLGEQGGFAQSRLLRTFVELSSNSPRTFFQEKTKYRSPGGPREHNLHRRATLDSGAPRLRAQGSQCCTHPAIGIL